MKIISWNVNGMRAIEKKGELQKFLKTHQPDIVCFQETKAKPEQLEFLEEKFPEYQKFYHSAEKAGYAGTAIWIHTKNMKNPEISGFSGIQFFSGFDEEIGFNDTEGRISRIDFSIPVETNCNSSLQKTRNFSLLGVYFPNGGKSPEAFDGETGKLVFYEKFLEQVNLLRNQGREVIFCGDVNTCHQAIDIARPKENDGKIGFHPLERQRISDWENNNWKDVWRAKNPEISGQYSWWSYRGGARSRNVGWRIDYFFVEKKLLPEISGIQYLNEQMGSDHCPLSLTF